MGTSDFLSLKSWFNSAGPITQQAQSVHKLTATNIQKLTATNITKHICKPTVCYKTSTKHTKLTETNLQTKLTG
jgi:hypothetical protein